MIKPSWNRGTIKHKGKKLGQEARSAQRQKMSPVTIITSVPWEREWDITEKFSVMGTPSLQPFLKSYWLTPVQLTGQLLRSMQIMTSSRQYKCGARDNYVRIWTERRLAGEAASTATTVISRSRSQGTEVTIVTGDVPFLSFTRHHREILRYGNNIQSRHERGFGQPVQVTH